MKVKINKLLLFSFFVFLTFFACQEETSDVNNSEDQEVIQPDSQLARAMSYVTANDGSYDNILDNSDCFSIELPVTIIVGDVTIVIETIENIEGLEEMFEMYEDDEDFLDFVFPITIIFNDYTEVIIENQDQLEDFIEDCEIEENEVVECVDFVYPISFSVFNSSFNIVDTVTIESDEALFSFLENLEEEENILIVSLNYPVTLEYVNGATIEVNSNQELAEAIETAEEDCEDNGEDQCEVEDVEMYLQECYWIVETYNGDDHLQNFAFHFLEDGTINVINGVTAQYIDGNWNTSISNEGYVEIVISDLDEIEEMNGSWIVYECDEDELVLKQEIDGQLVVVELEQECEDDLDCTAQEIALNLQECKWWMGTSLLSPNYSGPLFFYEDGIVNVGYDNGNQLTGTWEIVLGNTGVFLILDLPGNYEAISVEWRVVECEEDRIAFVFDEEELVLEQECEVQEDEVFDCFEDFELVECLGENNEAEFNLSANTIGLIDCQYNFTPSFHVSLVDAEANVSAIMQTESYWSVSGEVYLRIESDSGNFEIFTVYLNTEECNYFECFGNYDLTVCDQEDGVADGFGVFDLNLIFDNCPNDDVVYYFYSTIVDAETEVDALLSPFVNTIAYQQTIYSRVAQAGNPNVYEIFSHTLIVEDCSVSCSEEDVDGFLVECIWNAVNYNGSDNLMNWNFEFEPNSQIVVIYNDTSTIDATWSTSQSDDGVVVTFSNISGPNIQAIIGDWLVVECEEDRLQLHRGDDILVLEQNCE
jgi:hypothetical protein